jgi:hypothetical protein
VLDLDGIDEGFAGHQRPCSDAAPTTLMSIDDCGTLFDAVLTRLRATVGSSLARPQNGALGTLQADVLECVDELDRLRSALRQALSQVSRTDVSARGDDSPVPVRLP